MQPEPNDGQPVLVAVESDLGVVTQLGDQRGHPVGDLLHHQGAGAVDDIHALAARVGHDARLLREHGMEALAESAHAAQRSHTCAHGQHDKQKLSE